MFISTPCNDCAAKNKGLVRFTVNKPALVIVLTNGNMTYTPPLHALYTIHFDVSCNCQNFTPPCCALSYSAQLRYANACFAVLSCAVLFYPYPCFPALFTSIGSLCFFPYSSMASAPGLHAAVNDCSGKTQTHTFDCIPGMHTYTHMHMHLYTDMHRHKHVYM